jgi:hypothetical protein
MKRRLFLLVSSVILGLVMGLSGLTVSHPATHSAIQHGPCWPECNIFLPRA